MPIQITIFAQKQTLVEQLKWIVPLIISCVALAKGVLDTKRSRTESSTRARQAYNSELREWCNDCISTFLTASAAMSEVDGKKIVVDSAANLSALADQGRLFFVNPIKDIIGRHKEDAYRGLRPRILDWLVFAHDVCCKVEETPDMEAKECLISLRRGFVSDAQMAINPHSLFTTMEDLHELLRDGEFMEYSQSHKNICKADEFMRRRSN